MKFSHWFIRSIALVLGTIWSLGATASPPFDAPPGLAVAYQAQLDHGPSFLQIEGVVGHGLAKDKNGVGIITVYTSNPSLSNLPRSVDGVKVKPVFTGQFFALAPPKCGGPPSQRPDECFSEPEPDPSVDPTARFDRPVPIGVSSGHPDITAGTLGARVSDANGNVYALSNNHVFANSNDAVVGDNIIQPGPYDGGTQSSDYIATLHAFVPITFDGTDNLMDAAIASSDLTLLTASTPEDGYGSPTSNVVTATVGQSLQKYGRTTGFTQGTVDSVNATVNVCYEGSTTCTKLARFVNQIVITPGTFSAGGDSGSLIVTSNGNNPVGLLFAGSSSYTIANPIGPVLTTFDVTIDSEEPVEPPPPTGDMTLSVNGYKVKGQQKASLTWSGADSVDVYRDDMNSPLYTAVTSNPFVDNINAKGGGSYIYMVCEVSTNNCSNTASVFF